MQATNSAFPGSTLRLKSMQCFFLMAFENKAGLLGAYHLAALRAAVLSELSRDSSIRETFSHRSKFQLGESVKFFQDNLDHIGQLNFFSSKQDTLLARTAAKEIVEHDFIIVKIPLKMGTCGCPVLTAPEMVPLLPRDQIHPIMVSRVSRTICSRKKGSSTGWWST